MTLSKSLDYKVGDKFKVVNNDGNCFGIGELVKMIKKLSQTRYEFTNGKYSQTLYTTQFVPVLRPAKQALADAIHASGKGWPDGANWAAQDGDGAGSIDFFIGDKPKLYKRDKVWRGKYEIGNRIHKCEKTTPNWHQTVLSRDEYFSAYPEKVEPVADADEIESLEDVLAPDTTDTLLTAWQSAQAATSEARAALESAEQAEREAEEAVKAALGKYGWCESVVEDDDDWIEWSGGECPVAKGTMVDIKVRDGREELNLAANTITNGRNPDASCAFWNHDGVKGDIIAYRLSKS